MWQLRTKSDGTIYLTWDHRRKFDPQYRGIWEYVCSQDSLRAPHLIRANQAQGYLVANDDEGLVRVLVLTE